MFKHILVPTDFSQPAERALDLALDMAERFSAKVSILHVYEATQPVPYNDGVHWPAKNVELAAQNALDALVERANARYGACEGILRPPSHAADETVAVAGECGADLIVMGTHGRRGLSRFMLGSTAERVVRTAQVPVLTISARGQAATAATDTNTPDAPRA